MHLAECLRIRYNILQANIIATRPKTYSGKKNSAAPLIKKKTEEAIKNALPSLELRISLRNNNIMIPSMRKRVMTPIFSIFTIFARTGLICKKSGFEPKNLKNVK